MSQKAFIEKIHKVKGYTIIMDWTLGKYGITIRHEETQWQTDTYEFKKELDAQSVFELSIELCEKLVS